MTTVSARPRLLWVLAACIIVIGAALRFYDLGGPSLWMDEVFTLVRVQAAVDDTLLLVRDSGNQGPFYYLLLHAYPTGSDGTLRSFSALVGVGGIAGMMWLADRLYHSSWLTLAAGALLALNPYHIWLSRTARGYALMFVLALLASFAFLRLLGGSRRRDHWALLIVSSMIGYVTHYFFTTLAFAQYLVFGFFLRRKRALFRRWIGAQVVAAIPLLLWIMYMLQADTVAAGLGWIQRPGPEDLLLTVSTMTVGTDNVAPLLALPGALIALAGLGAGLVYAVRHYRAEPDLWYWFWLVAGTLGLVFAVSVIVRPLYVDRYFVVILPALIVLMLRGWMWLAGPKRPYFVAVAVVLVCLTGAGITVDVFQSGDHYKEDWRGAASYVADDFRPGDGVLASNPVELIAFKRYFDRPVFPYSWMSENDPLTPVSFTEQVRRVWVVTRTSDEEGAHRNELTLVRETSERVAAKYVPEWVRVRQDRVLAQKQFNGVAVFLVAIHFESD